MKTIKSKKTRENGTIILKEGRKYQYVESSVYGNKVKINKGDVEKYYNDDLELAWQEENISKLN